MMSRSSAVILSLSLMSSLTISMIAGCGSSKPKEVRADHAENQQEAAATAPSDEPRAPSEFCKGLSGVYCTNDYDSDPRQIKQTHFDDMSQDEQQAFFSWCEEAWEKADDKKKDIMQQCSGCVADCSDANSCLDGMSTGCPDFEEEDPSSEE